MSVLERPAELPRRTGDAIRIPGNYQHRAHTSGPVVQRFWHAEKEGIIRKYHQSCRGQLVIDVGCGSGVQSAVLASLGTRTIGVDDSARLDLPPVLSFERTLSCSARAESYRAADGALSALQGESEAVRP